MVYNIYLNPKVGSNASQGIDLLTSKTESKQAKKTQASFFHVLYIGYRRTVWLRSKVDPPTSEKQNPSQMCSAIWVLVNSRCCQVDGEESTNLIDTSFAHEFLRKGTRAKKISRQCAKKGNQEDLEDIPLCLLLFYSKGSLKLCPYRVGFLPSNSLSINRDKRCPQLNNNKKRVLDCSIIWSPY